MTPRRKNPNKPLRAIGYVRVSHPQQAESGLSLEYQESKIRAAATVYDLDLTDVVVDAAESAKSLDRPGVQRVLELARTKKVDAVVILKLDRLTRSVRDLADLLDLFQRRKVALISVSESLNTETAAGRMVVNVMGAVAQWEREAIGERTGAALATKRQRGERYSRHAPYGFRFAGKRLEEDPTEKETALLIVECRAAGYPWHAIAAELTRLNYQPRTVPTWTPANVRRLHQTFTKNREQEQKP